MSCNAMMNRVPLAHGYAGGIGMETIACPSFFTFLCTILARIHLNYTNSPAAHKNNDIRFDVDSGWI